MSEFVIVQNEEQVVEVYFEEEIVFHWNKDSDGYSIAHDIANLLSYTGNTDFKHVDADVFYGEDSE